MRVLLYDTESTGLDVKNDRIVEIGAILWDSEKNKVLKIISELIWDKTYPPMPAEVTAINGITDDMLKEFGKDPYKTMLDLDELCLNHGVEYVVAHNGTNFDKPITEQEFVRLGLTSLALCKLPWLDTKLHITVAKGDSSKLKYMAADIGVINYFEHRAVFDAAVMATLVKRHGLAQIARDAKEPRCIIRAMVPHPREDNGAGKDLAKSCGFRWQEIGDRKYNLAWVKLVKKSDFNNEQLAMKGYQLIILEEYV